MDASDLGPLFAHPAEPHRLWILAALVAAASLLIAATGLTRGQLAPGLAAAGLVLLPAFAYALGSLVILEESKRVEFCGSCHRVMGPLVASLSEENGSLAAIHFRDGSLSRSQACYTCHSGYGIWGGVRAKLAGVRHMFHAVTGRYELPLQLAHPFEIDACLACHAEAARFRAVEAHRDRDLQAALLGGQIGCTGLCHPAAHPEQALAGAGGPGRR